MNNYIVYYHECLDKMYKMAASYILYTKYLYKWLKLLKLHPRSIYFKGTTSWGGGAGTNVLVTDALRCTTCNMLPFVRQLWDGMLLVCVYVRNCFIVSLCRMHKEPEQATKPEDLCTYNLRSAGEFYGGKALLLSAKGVLAHYRNMAVMSSFRTKMYFVTLSTGKVALCCHTTQPGNGVLSQICARYEF